MSRFPPTTLYQMLFYSQGMADAIKKNIYIQGNGKYLQAVTRDSIDKGQKILAVVSPTKDVS